MLPLKNQNKNIDECRFGLVPVLNAFIIKEGTPENTICWFSIELLVQLAFS